MTGEQVPGATAERPTIQAPDPAQVPGATQAEFGPDKMSAGYRAAEAELAALEKSINAQLNGQPQPVVVPAPAAPAAVAPPAPAAPAPQAPAAAPAAAPQGVVVPPGTEVPAKFRNPDGTLDPQRVEQSLASLNDFLEKERLFHMVRSGQIPPQAVMAPPNQQPQPQPYPQYPQYPQYQTPQPVWPQPQAEPPLEDRVNADLRNNPGATVVNLMRAAMMESERKASADLQAMRSKLELMEMGQNDPGVFTKQGIDALTRVRMENPWLEQSPNPWALAYKLHGPIAPRNAAQATVPVMNGASPASVRPTAPIVPGGQPPASIPAGGVPIASEADLRRYLDTKFAGDPKGQYEYLERVIAAGGLAAR